LFEEAIMTPAISMIQSAYELARERYAGLGVDAEKVLGTLEKSFHKPALLAGIHVLIRGCQRPA
jgi:hypothetical protein